MTAALDVPLVLGSQTSARTVQMNANAPPMPNAGVLSFPKALSIGPAVSAITSWHRTKNEANRYFKTKGPRRPSSRKCDTTRFIIYLWHDDCNVEDTNGEALATVLVSDNLRSNGPWNAEQHLQDKKNSEHTCKLTGSNSRNP